jgi:hypothetical protein
MAHSGHAARLDSDDVALHLDDRASYLAALPVLHPTALLCATAPLVSPATMVALHPDGPAPCDPDDPVFGVGNHVDGSVGLRSCRTAR